MDAAIRLEDDNALVALASTTPRSQNPGHAPGVHEDRMNIILDAICASQARCIILQWNSCQGKRSPAIHGRRSPAIHCWKCGRLKMKHCLGTLDDPQKHSTSLSAAGLPRRFLFMERHPGHGRPPVPWK